MKYVILDTSFILSCVRKKIDLFEEIAFMGFKVIIPKQVIHEIEKFKDKKPEANLSLRILKQNKFKEINLNIKNVDNGIINLAKKNKEYIIATLDKEIKNRAQNQKLIIRGKRLEII